jgi:hypothetical protein
MEAAGRIGGHYRLYHATRVAVDVALDRADLNTAGRLLTDLDSHAVALETSDGTGTWTRETGPAWIPSDSARWFCSGVVHA